VIDTFMIEYLAPGFVYTVLKDAWSAWRRRRRSQPHSHPQAVDKWRLASDEFTLKEFAPGEWLEDWETKKQMENDLTRKLQKLSSGYLLGENPQPSSSLKLDVQKAQIARAMRQELIEVHIHAMLAQGELLARGIPNEAPPHDNKPIEIRPPQWQYLTFSVEGQALDSKGETVYKGLEIGKAKGQE